MVLVDCLCTGGGNAVSTVAITKTINNVSVLLRLLHHRNDDHIASYVEISVLLICVCAMFQEIIQNKLNLTVQSQEMRTKRRLLLVFVIIIVIIWFASLRNRGRKLWPSDTQCCLRKQNSPLPPSNIFMLFSFL